MQMALTDIARANLTDVDLDLAAVLTWDNRLDYDDFPDADLVPDLGQPDDDDPFVEEPDERAAVLPTRPDIVLWEGPAGIEWEIRPTSEGLLADPNLARLAVRRERDLERYAAGLADEFLSPRVVGQTLATATLVDVWDAIPLRDPEDPFDNTRTRWNTQAAISRRWGIANSEMSRDRTVLVSLPSSDVVPLQFFTWKTENDVLIKEIAKAQNVFSDSVKAVAESVTPQSTAQRTAKDFVPWVRAALRHHGLVRRSQDQFRSFPAKFDSILDWLRQSLREAEAERTRLEGGIPLGKQDRSLPVLQRALVGGI